MQLINYKDYTVIHVKKSAKLDKLIDFLKTSSFNPIHLIIDVSGTTIPHDIIVSELLPFHFLWVKQHKSFILISTIRKKVLKELVSLRSLEEAIDFFHMEQLTRNI